MALMAALLPQVWAEEADASVQPTPTAKVVVIPVRAQIAKPELYILRRGLKQAIENKVDTIILDMETPGGSAAVTLEIMEILDRFEGKKITYVNDEAGSAGAIIASVTDEIYFAPNGVMGAAELIFGTGQDVGDGLKRKMNSFLSAKIRAYSNDQPMRADVIKAMMDPEFEFKIGDEVIKAKGELLTVTAKEAVKMYGDPPQPLLASGIATSIDALVEQLHGKGQYSVVNLEVTWSEKLAQYITTFTPLLLAAGLLLLFIEFKTPGFGVFGIGGGILLGVVFFGHHAAGLSGHEPALFFALGLALIVIELFFLPGTFVLAISGGILMLGSLVWAMADFWPQEPLDFSGGVLVGPLANVLIGVTLAVVIFLVMLKYLPKGGLWGHMVLEGAVGGEPDGIHAINDSAVTDGVALIGKLGMAATALFPSGQVVIDGKRYEAKLDTGFAEAGTQIKVTGRLEFGLAVEVVS